MRYLRVFGTVLTGLVLMVIARPIQAQDDPNFETGLKAYGSFHGGDIDHVDLANGSLNLEIPLMSYPQRGGKLHLDFELEYENSGNFLDPYYDGVGDCWMEGQQVFNHGFEIVIKGTPTVSSTQAVYIDYSNTPYDEYGISVKMAEGAVHNLAPTSLTSWESLDGSGFKADTSSSFVIPPITDS